MGPIPAGGSFCRILGSAARKIIFSGICRPPGSKNLTGLKILGKTDEVGTQKTLRKIKEFGKGEERGKKIEKPEENEEPGKTKQLEKKRKNLRKTEKAVKKRRV